MHDGFFVDVVQLKGVPGCTVYQRRQRHGCFLAHAIKRRHALGAFGDGQLSHLLRPWQRGAVERATDVIEHRQLDAFDHLFG